MVDLFFDDVVKCRDTSEFNLFVRRYLAERGLVADGLHGNTSSVYWALFYKWRDSPMPSMSGYVFVPVADSGYIPLSRRLENICCCSACLRLVWRGGAPARRGA